MLLACDQGLPTSGSSHVCELACNPCALSGPYRPRGAHGFWTLLVHFSGKSASFDGKLSDRIVREF